MFRSHPNFHRRSRRIGTIRGCRRIAFLAMAVVAFAAIAPNALAVLGGKDVTFPDGARANVNLVCTANTSGFTVSITEAANVSGTFYQATFYGERHQVDNVGLAAGGIPQEHEPDCAAVGLQPGHVAALHHSRPLGEWALVHVVGLGRRLHRSRIRTKCVRRNVLSRVVVQTQIRFRGQLVWPESRRAIASALQFPRPCPELTLPGSPRAEPSSARIWLDGAAPESNRPSVGLPRPHSFEVLSRRGREARSAPLEKLRRASCHVLRHGRIQPAHLGFIPSCS